MDAPPLAGPDNPWRGRLGSWILLVAGVLFPAFTIGFELVTRMCAQSLFDPLSTLGHTAVVCAVPLINARLWWLRQRGAPLHRRWLFLGCAAAAVATCYAIVFLPIYPIALIGILALGLGALPFAPLAATVAAFRLVVTLGRREQQPYRRLGLAGFLSGMLLILALDVPAVVTRVAVRGIASEQPQKRARALATMRVFGDRELLLRLCYDVSGRSGGLLSLLVEGGLRLWVDDFDARHSDLTPVAARELYYRLNGEPYNFVEPPFRDGPWGFSRGFEWDADQGGAAVGGRVRDLRLRSSRIDGSLDGDDAVAYVEWTTEFSNASQMVHEARMTLALPPGAVVSRATLWVGGEEREAVFASREATRAAYEAVVHAQRDPLLVTTNGADQVFVQMFPVPPGGSAKLRIGITAPLTLSNDGRATLVLPAIVDRNFSIEADLRHAVWIEGDGRAAPSDPGFTTMTDEGAVFRRRASFSDAALTTQRPRIAVLRNPQAESSASGAVIQTIRREPHEPAGALFVVLDGSVRAKPAAAALLAALERIPPGARVGFAVASSEPATLALAPWSVARRAELEALLARQPFDAGEDNVGALAEALVALQGQPAATLLWIHAPQGYEFAQHQAELDQVLDRSTRLPELWLLPVAPGPNKLLQNPRLFKFARTLPWSGDDKADIAAAFTNYFDDSPRWTIRRTPASDPGLARGSEHIEKLWALEEIESLIAQGSKAAPAAQELATRFHLVTPVSGAVVLETNADYYKAGLAPPDPASVPTIPEPSTWAMLIVACIIFAWALRRQRAARA